MHRKYEREIKNKIMYAQNYLCINYDTWKIISLKKIQQMYISFNPSSDTNDNWVMH